ncbi:MAG TPA: glycoside hydrolase family 97 N-terminal domain-containing protein, partial [Pilimelia sp.]|nr:glycoside hydrolase family 97 N-terminal domain-containing protein [Pilimelia sp.]
MSAWKRMAAGAATGALVVGMAAGPAGAAPAPAPDAAWTVAAPGGDGPVAVVRHHAGGTVSLAVTRGGRTVLEPSPVGIVTEQVDLSTGLRPVGRSSRRVVERYVTTVGKRLARRTVMTETRFAFSGAGNARVDLVVRVSRDGVAYRYVLPDNRGAVLREASAFTVPADSPA